MAATIIGFNNVKPTAAPFAVNSITVPMPAEAAAGKLAIFFATQTNGFQNPGYPSIVQTGWTFLGNIDNDTSPGSQQGRIWWKILDGTETEVGATWPFTDESQGSVLILEGYDDVSATPFPGFARQDNENFVSQCAEYTTTVADALLIAFLNKDRDTPAWGGSNGAPAGWTQLYYDDVEFAGPASASRCVMGIAHRVYPVSGTATGQIEFAHNSNSSAWGYGLTLEVAPGGGGLDLTGQLDGQAAGQGSAAGDLQVGKQLAGTVAGTSSVAGEIGQVTLGGSAAGAGTVQGDLEGGTTVSDALTTANGVYLVEIEAFQGTSGTVQLSPEVHGTFPHGGRPFGDFVPSGLVEFAFATRDWRGEPDDDVKPNTYIEGRVINAIRMSRRSPVLPEDDRRLQAQYGSVTLANGDGSLNSLIRDFAISGRRVRVSRGGYAAPRSRPYSSFVTLLDGLGVAWRGRSAEPGLIVRDTAFSVETPLQKRLYQGNGGEEGNAEFTSKPMPITLGFRRNIVPDLIDPANLAYRVHSRSIQSVMAVRDRGGLLAKGIDHGDYASLIGATVVDGEFHTCHALGLFRIKFISGQGLITCDVEGDNVGGYVDTHEGIALRVLDDFGAIATTKRNAASFSVLPGGKAGMHVRSNVRPTVGEGMDRVLRSCGGWWGPRRDGIIRAGRTVDPQSMDPVMSIGFRDMRSVPVELPVPAQPRFRQTVSYREIEQIQRGVDLLDSVSAADRQFLSQKFRTTADIDTDVQLRYPLADDLAPIDSLFDEEADAFALAQFLLNIHKQDRASFAITIGPEGYKLELDDVVLVTYPTSGLESGRRMVVTGIEEFGDQVTLTVWG